MRLAKLLICGGEDMIEVDSGKLQFSFETHEQMVKLARRLLCGAELYEAEYI